MSNVIPPILYKYREDSRRTEEVIRSRKIWLSTPDKLNDPLECKTGVIPEEAKNQTIREMESAQLMGVLGTPITPIPKTLFSLDERKTKLWFRKLRRFPFDRKVQLMRELYRKHGIELSNPRLLFDSLQKQLSQVGIFSMTSVADNQPMWAHYAGNHTGIALGFSAPSGSKLDDPHHTLPVVYSATKPSFDGKLLHKIEIFQSPNGLRSEGWFSFDDPLFRAAICTKPPAWSYEQEWRYVEQSSGQRDFPGELRCVIFGCRMPDDRRRHYANLVQLSGTNMDVLEVTPTADGSMELRPYPAHSPSPTIRT